MDSDAFDFLRRENWAKAIEQFDQLLNAKTCRKDDTVKYLTARSKCLLELKQFESVIADCRRIIDSSRQENVTFSARQKLIQALFALKKFQDAELVIQEWVSSRNGPNQLEVAKILKQLHAAHTGDGNGLEKVLTGLGPQLKAKMEVVQCTYCSISFKSKAELRGHCQTEEHQRVIMSDEGRDWQWRPPPRGCDSESYRLCDHWSEVGVCRYGMQCIEAHGVEELQEWKERFEYRRMKLQRAYDSELYGKSYTEELVDKLVQSLAPEHIMRETLDDVEVVCDNKLITTLSEKNRLQSWVFKLKTIRILKAIALLQDTHRSYFHIKSVKVTNGLLTKSLELSNPQEWIAKGKKHAGLYQVEIIFRADIYGTLRQSIVFDFGTEPMLVKHLCVDVVPVTDIDKLNEIRNKILVSSCERWNSRNCKIIEFSSRLTSLLPSHTDTETEWAKHLASVYPAPHPETFMLSQATIKDKRLTKNTYRSRMHELLYIEEMARYECIARFNVTGKLKIIHSYLLSPNSTASSTAKYSSSGELFALLHLGKELSEDTPAGRLILNSCATILVSPEDKSTKVYQALIEDKGKNMIYLRLSSQTVKDLKLKSDTEYRCQMQFQLNRIPYCEWHYAIDKIPNFKIIFPEVFLEPNIPWTPARQWSESLDSRMNLKQKEAVVAITTPLYINLPPVLIIGPFGTGKTFTLAQAIKQLVQQPETRMLICTQSNSAADLYIKDYLDPYVESGHEEAKPLRIYYHKRWVATVNQVVQKYCMINTTGGMKQFIIPTLEDIMKHRIIVVTLSISMYLSTIGLPRGFFTHIFLDEAAQAMECEAIMPLALATENTRIVLAGDHMQMSPELFSSFAKDRNLHVSLLERLYDHYPNGFPCKILLSENYRAHEAIIQFTSELFYDQKLISSGKQPRHGIFYPLTFFTSRGEDIQDLNSTAYYNNSEVYEIVERVQELKKHWPPAWGKFDQGIGIMTPYSDQVLRIRSELRKRRLYGVSVERVLNVQGKQFRAIFLSTVRTRRTCKVGEDSDFGFLSNSKLLNTAITRAQSLVAVVGDPISLCSIGRCSKVWERFIQICDENNSLYGISWLSIRNHLDGVELKKTYTLNPLAPEFVPRQYKKPEPPKVIPSIPKVFHTNPMMMIPPQTLIPPPTSIPPIFPGMFPLLPPQTLIPPIIPNPFLLPSGLAQLSQIPTIPTIPPRIDATTKLDELLFRNNLLHIPDFSKTPASATLTDYIHLLPPNMSLIEMLLQPLLIQQQWYFQLLMSKGPEAAKQFELLILTANKKENNLPQPTTLQLPHFPILPQPQQQIFNSTIRPMACSTSTVVPQIPPQQLATGMNIQYLYNKQPTYVNHQPATAVPPKNEIQTQVSQPLYLRHSETDLKNVKIQSNVNSNESGSSSSTITKSSSDNDEVIPRQWQQQINAEFANLSLHNGESADDAFNRFKDSGGLTTYASVVRNLSNDKLSLNNGPRLYQYF